MGYIVPFLTISSILIDVCFTDVIFTGTIFNSYNYWYLLSYSNQFTLHYSILFLIISIIIIVFLYYYISWTLKAFIPALMGLSIFSPSTYYLKTDNQSKAVNRSRPLYSLIHLFNLISISFFSNFTFFIPIFLDFFLIFSIFFFKYIINSIEVFTSFNPCYSIFYYNFFSLFFYIQLIILGLLSSGLKTAILEEKRPFCYYQKTEQWIKAVLH